MLERIVSHHLATSRRTSQGTIINNKEQNHARKVDQGDAGGVGAFFAGDDAHVGKAARGEAKEAGGKGEAAWHSPFTILKVMERSQRP